MIPLYLAEGSETLTMAPGKLPRYCAAEQVSDDAEVHDVLAQAKDASSRKAASNSAVGDQLETPKEIPEIVADVPPLCAEFPGFT